MVRELSETWTPEKILFRDSQIQELRLFFYNFEKNLSGKNIVLQGNTGNGKTLVIDSVRNHNGNEKLHLYAKAQEKGTAFQLFKDLFNIQDSRTIGNLIQRGIQKLKKEPKAIIIEEINRLNKNELKALFSCLNEITRETEFPIAVITNIFGINQYMRDDQKSSLMFYFIDFPAYSELELFEIFFERKIEIEKNNPDVKLSEEDIKRVCHLVYEKGVGSARQVRRVINECINSNFTEENITKIIEGTFDESCFSRILNMPQSERNFLNTLVKINNSKKEQIYQGIEYSELITHLEGISTGRISQFVDIFENEYHLIYSKYPSGRGRKRIIYLDNFFFNNAVKFGVINLEEFLPEQKLLKC